VRSSETRRMRVRRSASGEEFRPSLVRRDWMKRRSDSFVRTFVSLSGRLADDGLVGPWLSYFAPAAIQRRRVSFLAAREFGVGDDRGMTAAGSLEKMRAMSSLWSGSPGTMGCRGTGV